MTGLNSVLYFITTRTIHSLDMKAGKLTQTVDLPNGYSFCNLTEDEETGLMAATSVQRKQSDILMVFGLYQSDPCLYFQQLLEVCVILSKVSDIYVYLNISINHNFRKTS